MANPILIASQMHLDNMASRPVQIERPTSPFPEPLGLHDFMTGVLYWMSGKTQAHLAMTGRHMIHFIEQYRKGQNDQTAPLTPGCGRTDQPDNREESLSPWLYSVYDDDREECDQPDDREESLSPWLYSGCDE